MIVSRGGLGIAAVFRESESHLVCGDRGWAEHDAMILVIGVVAVAVCFCFSFSVVGIREFMGQSQW